MNNKFIEIEYVKVNIVDKQGNMLYKDNIEFVFDENLTKKVKKYCGKLCGKLVILDKYSVSFPQENIPTLKDLIKRYEP